MISFDKQFLLTDLMCSLVWHVDANSYANSATQLFIFKWAPILQGLGPIRAGLGILVRGVVKLYTVNLT